MNYIGIIPARYASTRFPGKPLAMLGGKPVIQRVYEQVSGVMDDVLVATDDERILKTVEGFGGKAVMTARTTRAARTAAMRLTYCRANHTTWSSTSRATNLSSNRSSWKP